MREPPEGGRKLYLRYAPSSARLKKHKYKHQPFLFRVRVGKIFCATYGHASIVTEGQHA